MVGAETVDRNDLKINTHFNLSEFACRCDKHCGGFVVYEPKLVRGLALLRSKLEILHSAGYIESPAVVINCAVRCRKHNEEIGGVENSEHLFCDGHAAADVATHRTGRSPLEIAELAQGLEPLVVRDRYPRIVHREEIQFLGEKIVEFERIGVYGTALNKRGYHGKRNFIHLGIKTKFIYPSDSQGWTALPSRWGDWPDLAEFYRRYPEKYRGRSNADTR